MTNSSQKTLIVSFEDFSDLQTRLVLLPLIEDEGIGARVASYFPNEETEIKCMGDSDLSGYILFNIVKQDSQPNEEVLLTDLKCPLDASEDLTTLEFSAILALIREAPSPIVLSLVGSLQSTSTNKTKQETSNKSQKSSIKTPYYYDVDGEEKKVETDYNTVPRSDHQNSLCIESNSCRPTAESQRESSVQPHTSELNYHTVPEETKLMDSSMGKSCSAPVPSASSFWTKRFIGEATLQQLASGAASSAANLARAANERASKLAAAASANKSASSASGTCASISTNNHNYAIYKQCVRTGEFLKVQNQKVYGYSNQDPSSESLDESLITNTSLLAIRCSSVLACPKVSGQSFQWYRSSTLSMKNDQDGYDNFDSDSWQILHGAEQAVFQPSATEVGYWLKCVITILQTENEKASHDDSDDSTVSSVDSLTCQDKEGYSLHESANKSSPTKRITCELLTVVSADSSLWKGARQALVRGFQFTGIIGVGNAEGRNFTLRIRTARRKHASLEQSKNIVCVVTIYQVSSGVSEPIHAEDSPMICVGAVTDAGYAKQFELILAAQSTAASMVSALSLPYMDDVDDSSVGSHPNQGSESLLMRLQLQAPNRLARESLLLAIGVANYSGEASNFNESVILFANEKRPSISSSWSLASNASTISLWALADFDSDSVIEDDNDVAKLVASPFVESNVTSKATSNTKSVLSDSFHVDQCIQTPVSLDMSVLIKDGASMPPLNVEQELLLLREKLVRKDKIIAELQRSLAQADEETRTIQSRLDECQKENARSNEEKQTFERTLQSMQLKLKRVQDEGNQLQQTHQLKEIQLQKTVDEKIVELNDSVKANRALHNEIAVLSAAVEARESKLVKMAEIKASLEAATVKLSQNESIEQDLIECEKRLVATTEECQKLRIIDTQRTLELESAQRQILELQGKLKMEASKACGHQSELEKEQMKVQKLKAERNSYKQKGESLAKEIARVCRNGRSIRDIEKIISDDIARRQEVELLRQQKQAALDEAQNYRILLEQSRMTQKLMSNGNGNVESSASQKLVKLLHRNEELERLLSELTEYVTAKEMQLETMKQINDALQTEIRDLAKANMSKNEV